MLSNVESRVLNAVKLVDPSRQSPPPTAGCRQAATRSKLPDRMDTMMAVSASRFLNGLRLGSSPRESLTGASYEVGTRQGCIGWSARRRADLGEQRGGGGDLAFPRGALRSPSPGARGPRAPVHQMELTGGDRVSAPAPFRLAATVSGMDFAQSNGSPASPWTGDVSPGSGKPVRLSRCRRRQLPGIANRAQPFAVACRQGVRVACHQAARLRPPPPRPCAPWSRTLRFRAPQQSSLGSPPAAPFRSRHARRPVRRLPPHFPHSV